MAEYREIQGAAVQSLASNTGTIEGQIWYDNVNGAFKLQSVTTAGAWATGGNLSTGRNISDSFGTKTAGAYVGGQPSTPYYNLVEEYDGTSWTAGTVYPQNKTSGGTAGTLTAGLVAGGNVPPFTTTANQYDGTTWTGTGPLPTAADNIGPCGADTISDVIMALGRIPSTGNSGNNTTATYNGATFSSGPNINTARMFGVGSGAGTGTAGLIMGGFIDPSPNAMTNCEEYNGSSWSTVNPLNTVSGLNSGFGTQTSAIMQVNSPGPGNRTGIERYDGTSWTTVAALPIGPNGGYASSTGSSASAGGWFSGLGASLNGTNEWTDAGSPETQTITTT